MTINTKYALLIGGGATAISGGGMGIYLLSQDKTIKDRLTREGIILINNEEEYQVAFKEFKSDSELTTAISVTGKTINSGSSKEDGGNALKAWCEKNFNTSLNISELQNLITKTKKYCVKPPLTIQEKIANKKQKLVSDWTQKLNTIKNPPASTNTQLLEDLKTKNGTLKNLDGAEAVSALEAWCKGNSNQRLINDETDAIWTKVEARCIEPINS